MLQRFMGRTEHVSLRLDTARHYTSRAQSLMRSHYACRRSPLRPPAGARRGRQGGSADWSWRRGSKWLLQRDIAAARMAGLPMPGH